MSITVLSLGGSLIAPEYPDTEFLTELNTQVREYLAEDPERKLIFVCGGGAPARIWQQAAKKITTPQNNELDMIGIRATHLNGQLVHAIFGDLTGDPLVIDPTDENISFNGRVLIAGGWKPGFSSDNDAILLAHRFGSSLVINLSNIEKVYTADPKTDPDAKPIDTIGWDDFRKIVGDTWVPGKNTPFDPIASREAQKYGMKVICAKGSDIANTMAILRGEKYNGTLIG